MEKSSGSDGGGGCREGWDCGRFLSSLPRTTCIFAFMGYAFAVLDEWVTLQSRIRPGTDFSEPPGCWRKLVQGFPAEPKPEKVNFWKFIGEKNLSGTISFGYLLHWISVLWYDWDQWDLDVSIRMSCKVFQKQWKKRLCVFTDHCVCLYLLKNVMEYLQTSVPWGPGH